MSNKCDKCENLARYELLGNASRYNYLCAKCAADICLSLGDLAGFNKFMAVSNAL